MKALTVIRTHVALLRLARIKSRHWEAARAVPMDNVARMRAQSLLAGTLYRDGSKMSQAMATNLDLLEGIDTLVDDDAPKADKVEALAAAIAQMRDDAQVHTVILTGAGGLLVTLGVLALDLRLEVGGLLRVFAVAVARALG